MPQKTLADVSGIASPALLVDAEKTYGSGTIAESRPSMTFEELTAQVLAGHKA